MTAKQINEKLSLEDLDGFIGATLEDMKRVIIAGTRTEFQKLANKRQLTTAKALDAIWRVAHSAHENIQAQVTQFLGDEDEVDAKGKPLHPNAVLVADIIFGLRESVIKRCGIALSDKKARANFTLELANAIVEQITEITRAEIDKDFDEAIEQMERERKEMDERMDAYFKEEEEKMRKEREANELKAFGRILTEKERAEKEREFLAEAKKIKARVKAAKLVREYNPGNMTEWQIFEFLFRETTKAIMELGEKPQGFWVDVNACKDADSRFSKINEYVKWVEAA